MTRLPRLLGPDLVEKARLHPSAASVTINLSPLSTASITLPQGEQDAGIRDFVELYGPDGSLGFFRVSSAQTTYGNQQQLTLEHGIVTLEDDMIPDGTVLSGSMKDMLAALLGHQNNARWKLGDVEVSGGLDDVEAGMANLLEAVLTIIGQDETAMLAFDQSAYPWVLHVRKKPDAVSCECRLNRNMSGVNVRLDDTELCTRVTVEDADGKLTVYDADTISTWGVVHTAITVDEGDDPKEEARKYLDAHKNPALSVELDAFTLSSLTGEPFDSFTVGQMCRVALPEWGVVMDERIVSISYSDLFGKPEQVRLTLSGTRTDAATRLATLQSVARKNSQGIRQNLKYYHELDDRAVIMAEQIELRATKDELGKYLNEVWIELNAHDASITLQAQHIDKITNDVSQAGIRIDGLNADLKLWAQKTEENGKLISAAQLDIDGANAKITAQASRIDKVEGRTTQAELAIDGANALITAQAQQLDAQGNRLSSAEVIIDGLKSDILLKADKTVTDGLDKRLNEAKVDIDGANASITAQAKQLDAQGKQISAAEIRMDGLAATIDLKVSKDGLISAINMSPETITIQASKINLSGYVTASQLSATNATINNLMSGVTSATKLVSSSADLGSVACTSVTVRSGGASIAMSAHYRGYLDANGDVQYAYFLST